MLTTETLNQTNEMCLSEILLQTSIGLYKTQAIYVAAKLGIADLLKDGAKSIDELAKLTDVNAQYLYAVLRALSSVGIFTEGENQHFQLTPLAEYLQTDFPGSLRDFVIFLGEPRHLQVWGDLFHNVKTGKTAFKHVFGMGLFPYLALHPGMAQILKKGMASLASSCIPTILASYDFSSISKIVNIAGGRDILIAEILNANPSMKGILFDQPSVVKGARNLIKTKGLAERCEIVGGNFLESVPSGGDGYIMKSIIHDLDVERALIILKNCHQAMAKNAKLLLLEKVIPPGNQPAFSKWLDLEMFLMGRGRVRTETDYREFLAAAGFMLTKVVYTQSPINIIEAVKV